MKPLTQRNKFLEGLNLQKLAQNVQSLLLSKDFEFYIIKNAFLGYEAKYFFFVQIFGDLTSPENFWAV